MYKVYMGVTFISKWTVLILVNECTQLGHSLSKDFEINRGWTRSTKVNE